MYYAILRNILGPVIYKKFRFFELQVLKVPNCEDRKICDFAYGNFAFLETMFLFYVSRVKLSIIIGLY